ncbi:MAG: ISKra4 family transposase [Kiritimatiellae bacterium]|nr:ISKra4 family transposase [Kiritimatiellia bacterium]
MSEEDVVAWLYDQASMVLGKDADMGAMENALRKVGNEPCRKALECMVQEKANDQDMLCPKCEGRLNIESYQRARSTRTSFDLIRFTRDYGFCPNCKEYIYPVDVRLGLHTRATASPKVQEICALTTLRAPAGQAQDDVLRLTGIKLDASTIHREAIRQGERALQLRDIDETLTQTPKGIAKLASRSVAPKAPFTLIIEIDAWNIRERDNWGKTQAFVKAGEDTGRWHWVYTGTVFRLDQRGTSESGRSIITERGYVATRRGIESFQKQLYAEALQRGLIQAEQVLIIADGAIWIWNIANDRFKGATQRVDLYHVKGHLWGLANAIYGKGTIEAREWVRPLLSWLERRKKGALDVISSMEEMKLTLTNITKEQREAIDREINYFNGHKDRMDYKTGSAKGQPVGSGAIESTCSQYQRRFKLTGQFWSLAGDEAFLALSSLHRNGRWKRLFPFDPV